MSIEQGAFLLTAIQTLVTLLIFFRVNPWRVFGSQMKTVGNREKDSAKTTTREKIMLALIIGALLSSAYGYYRVTWKIGGAAPLIQGWGVTTPFQCIATVTASMLMPWREKYDFVVVCGYNDPTQDMVETTQIGVSPRFTIRPDSISVKFPVSRDMLEAREKKKKASPKGLSAIWYQVALLPKGTDVSNIKHLSDIPRYGGVFTSDD